MTADFQPYISKDRYIGPHHFDVHIEDAVGRDWYDTTQNLWMQERQWCMDVIKPGFNILDCGAHQGVMTLLFALCTGPTGIVHAWEPVAQNASLIARNAALNGCHNVIVHQRGVGSAPGIVPVNDNLGNVVIHAGDHMPVATGTIQIVRVDDDIPADLHVDLLKIDVEGYELQALHGASRVLSQRPLLMIEMHNFLFADRRAVVSEIVQLLQGHNYRFRIDDFTSLTDAGYDPDIGWLADLKHAQLLCHPD